MDRILVVSLTLHHGMQGILWLLVFTRVLLQMFVYGCLVSVVMGLMVKNVNFIDLKDLLIITKLFSCK